MPEPPMYLLIENMKTIRLQRCNKTLSFNQYCGYVIRWEHIYCRCNLVFVRMTATWQSYWLKSRGATVCLWEVMILGVCGIRRKKDAPTLLKAWTVSWLWSLLQGSEIPFLALAKIWLPRGTLHISAGWSSLPYYQNITAVLKIQLHRILKSRL